MNKKWQRDYGEGHNIDEIGAVASATGGVLTCNDDGGNTNNNSDRIVSLDRSSLHNHDEAERVRGNFFSSWPVILYLPNLMGYLRIILSFIGLKHALQQQSHNALNTWITAALLDLVDGIVARRLNQLSQFGVFLDVMADNILRTTVWISAMIEISKSDSSWENDILCVWAAIVISLEWITFFCAQSNRTNRNGDQTVHWKDVKRTSVEEENRPPPFWVQAVFKNNFRSFFGIFAIFGLFVAPLGTYVWYADRLAKITWPSRILSERNMSILIIMSYAGRFLSAMVELWLCYNFFRGVIATDKWQQMKQKDS
mmetsp:Transcript_5136/g.11124  ORF Transcript_5136/g.11124 Transcript_5136/m.11124 type:complete len:312 (-) Transcript_5136:153-1088(-)|eukprot:CAMPEP_0172539146 /NCGR_PEP_ID=MMETSP1067-20121228/10401_1 /TAXON_ID=265564 ORGANISM="Thalassiosira punctigera, Strain Tpunct2005C2" /NCGR_SAMPLE_ID=MMETSP1067 /ASSEMBLY_ACC=CAM_ASM_000444 /LENGTH=311 /DNA_ID=CAMNT_0013324777 /DNA_START=42 /DNA_END=977 /DNA_ORIENTATION=-